MDDSFRSVVYLQQQKCAFHELCVPFISHRRSSKHHPVSQRQERAIKVWHQKENNNMHGYIDGFKKTRAPQIRFLWQSEIARMFPFLHPIQMTPVVPEKDHFRQMGDHV